MMKNWLAWLLIFNCALAQAGPFAATAQGVPGAGTVPLTSLATEATNTVVGNATSGTASPTALAVGSCSTASSALIWTTNTGFGCNTSITAATQVVRSYLAGLTLSTAGSSATMSIAAGVATDGTNVSMMTLAAFTKTTSAWSLGSAGGAMDTGSVANSTWYHWFLIQRTDTSVVDVLFSLSPTAPTMPTNYTLKRRIGSGKTNGSAQWVSFIQDGDLFQWLTPVLDVNAASGGTSAVTQTLASVPTGVSVRAFVNAMSFGGGASNSGTYLSDLATTDLAPSTSAAPLYSPGMQIIAVGVSAQMTIRTNTSAQIRSRDIASDATIRIATLGWFDRRGQDN